MGINVFQIGELNVNIFSATGGSATGTSVASEFPLAFDNINASGSRLAVLYGVWGSVDGSDSIFQGGNNDSYTQPNGQGNNPTTSNGQPLRPNGSYFMRGLFFQGTVAEPNPGRNGYIGSFVSGLGWGGGFYGSGQYCHDINGTTVDYGEPIYSHGQFPNPVTANFVNQWRDSTNPPSDGTDLIVNSGSVYGRTQYMPPSFFQFHIASAGANTLGSGDVSFFFENKPTLRAGGYDDGNRPLGAGSSLSTSFTVQGAPGPYSSDPLGGGAFSQPTINPYEYYQATGVRKLNSRGLSLHLAKVIDNGWAAFGYLYEEDGITLAPNHVSGQSGLQVDLSVNCQTEYTWVRDKAVPITAVSTDGAGNTTITAANQYTIGQVVLVQGLINATFLNGQFLTITALVGAGPTYLGFVATGVAHGAYGPTTELVGATQVPSGYAVYNPDFRIRQHATFNINEDYYGFVADTKCTIWSNRASAIPLLFFDLADIWGSGGNPRIAGVAVIPSYVNATQQLMYQLFFLSEGGSLARYDFTQTNGVLELAGVGSFSFASNAPAIVAAGEAYGAFRARGLTAPITATSVTSNVLTVTAANNFSAGDVVNITGTAESFLNNQTVTVLASGLSTSTFKANYTTANYTNASDTGSAAGYSLWAMYGTMNPDPRVPQTGLTNNANINLYRYNIGAGTWSSIISSGLPGRHNGRSLHEMIVKRDGNLYLLVEDVTTSAGFNVANSFGSYNTATNINWQLMVYDPVTAAWNTSKINGTTLFQYGTNMGPNQNTPNQQFNYWFYNINAFMHDVAPDYLLIQNNWTAGNLQLVNTTTSPALTNSNVTVVPTGSATPGTLFPADGFWFNNGYVQPLTQPIDITHNRDYATGNDRTIFYPNNVLYIYGGTSSNSQPIYEAFPSFNWSNLNAGVVNTSSTGNLVTWVSGQQFTNIYPGYGFVINGIQYIVATVSGPTSLTLTSSPGNQSGVISNGPLFLLGSNPGSGNSTTAYYQNSWTLTNLTTPFGDPGDRLAWAWPILLQDNYMAFARPSAGQDGIPGGGSNAGGSYGRGYGQAICYIATYWKWTGSQWIMADAWADAMASPYIIPSANTNIPLPYGLQCQFGPASGTSYTGGEFSTWNICWGNTKYTRRGRYSWAMFTGQTFVNSDTRTLATQNAMSANLVDTDISSVVYTAPTSATPNTAPVNTPSLGWVTQFTWPKLDAAHAGYDATPFQMVLTAKDFDHTTFAFPSAVNVIASGSSPNQTYAWTVGANTYVASSSSDQVQSGYGMNTNNGMAWNAFAGNPTGFWYSSNQVNAYLQIDLGSGNPQTVLTYSFRPVYTTGDSPINGTAINYQLWGSNTGAFAGEQVVVDDRTGGNALNPSTLTRVMAFTCNGTTGSFRYYRFNVTNGGGSYVAMGMIRMSTAAFATTINFTDFLFAAYGSQGNNAGFYPWQRNWQFCRGLTIEVSTNGGGTYTTIMEPNGSVALGTAPLWRMFNGFGFTFPRQTGVTNIRVTVQHGYNFSNVSGNVPTATGFGPFYLIDYEPQNPTGMVATNAARLGNSLAVQGTSTAGSFDQQCLGIATDVASISIDSTSPNLYSAYSALVDGSAFQMFDFCTVGVGNMPTTSGYKIHPFFGFILFPGAGADGVQSTQSGTNMAITYQWGRRV